MNQMKEIIKIGFLIYSDYHI